MWLKQSTTVTVILGPFVDKTDGVTEETGLAGSMTVQLSKNGGGFSPRNSATAITHDATLTGNYLVELDTTDTNSLGRLRAGVQASATHLPVWIDFMVLPANVWDSMFGADKLQIDIAQCGGSTVAAGAIPNAAAGVNGGLPTVNSSNQVAGHIVRSATAQAGGAASITLDAGASGVNDFYNFQIVFLVGGTGAGQSKIITAYNGTTKVATVNDNWATQPDVSSVFTIFPFGSIPGASAPTAAQNADAVWDEARADHVAAGSFGQSAQIVRSGTAQAGGAASITLDAGASAVNDFYINQTVFLVGATGAGQSRRITAYNGTSKVATVDLNWATPPGVTSVFLVLPIYVLTGSGDSAATIWAYATRALTDKTDFVLSAAGVQAIWDALTSALSTIGSIGKKLADWVIGTAQSGDAFVRLGAPAGASVSADIAAVKAETTSIQSDTNDLQIQIGAAGAGLTAVSQYIDTEVAAIKAKTDNLPASPAAVGDIPTTAQIADRILGRYIAGGSDGGARTVTSAFRTIRNKVDTVAVPGKAIIYQEDDLSEDHRRDLTTSPSAEPIVTEDPTT